MCKKFHLLACIFTLVLLNIYPYATFGFQQDSIQDQSLADRTRRIVPLDSLSDEPRWQVGVYNKPPFMIKEENGQWDGIAIRLWEDLAEAINVTYDFREVKAEEVYDELSSGKIDVVPGLPIEHDKMESTLYTQHYYVTVLGVASSRTKKLSRIAKSLFTWQFFRIVIALSILLAVVGLIVWAVERNSNEKQFGGERNFWKGLGAGFWWAGVTMTTIGYGDKAPQTTAGRAVALIWMLIAMGITASLTAAIVGAVNDSVSTAKSIPEDLRGKKTAVISGTAYAEYLDDKNVKLTDYEDPKKALTALNEASENTFFIHDIAEMRYYISRMDNINVITSATELLPQHYAFALHSTHAAYLPHLNKALVRVISEPEWLKEANSFAPDIKQ